MPYKQIQFVKIKMEILEDYRFLVQLNTRQKGFYLMLLALAGKTNNKILNNPEFIKGRLALLDTETSVITEDLKEISKVYPKFKLNKDIWQFEEFDKEHNYILGNSLGTPQELPGYAQNKNKKENKNKKRIEDIPYDSQKAANPDIKIFLDFWFNSYKQVFNASYLINGGKDGEAVRRLLAGRSLDDLKRLALKFLRAKDDFTMRAGHTIGVFYSQINKLAESETPEYKRREEMKGYLKK